MFAILMWRPSGRHGITGRLLDNLLPRKVITQTQTALDVEYLQITICGTPNARAWRRVEQAAGDLGAQMVVAQDLTVPDDAAIAPFTGEERFLPLLCVNTAARALTLSQLPFGRRTVGIIDPRGIRQSLVLRLLGQVGAVVVKTDVPARYEAFCDQVLESFGAPVMLAGEDSDLSACAVIAAPDGLDGSLCRQLTAPVVSAHPQPAACRAPVLSSLEPQPPPGVEPPASVSPARFLGALFELGGVNALENLAAQYGRVDGRMTTVAQFAQRIRQVQLKSQNKT